MGKWVLGIALASTLFAAGCGDVDVPDHPDPLGHCDGDERATNGDSGSAKEELLLKTKDVKFDPGELSANVGVPTVLTLENLDDVEHDFRVDEIDAAILEGGDDPDEDDDGHTSGDLSVHAEAGQTNAITFVAHEPGVYEFYCTVSGHKEAGMVGTLTLE